MVRKTGVDADILYPTLEDFRMAHIKACFHESPVPPDSKSDEMRDLVIWMSALRIARENSGALLLSRDKVHTHSRGNDEADQAKLKRFGSVEDVLTYLGAEGPVAKPIREILQRAWLGFTSHGFPIDEIPSRLSILESRFVRAADGVGQVIEARIEILEDAVAN